jgi:hypothetical protein
MIRFLVISAILFPLAVGAAEAGSDSFSLSDCKVHKTRSFILKEAKASQQAPQANAQQGKGPFPVAPARSGAADIVVKKAEEGSEKEIDLRNVDWQTVKGNDKEKDENVKNGDEGEDKGDGDKEGEDDDKKDDKKDDKDKKEDEGGGGWDRLWDAPKLG